MAATLTFRHIYHYTLDQKGIAGGTGLIPHS